MRPLTVQGLVFLLLILASSIQLRANEPSKRMSLFSRSRNLEEKTSLKDQIEKDKLQANKLIQLEPKGVYYLKFKTSSAEFLIAQFVGDEQIGEISAKVVKGDQIDKTQQLKNEIEDSTNVFYVSKDSLKEMCQAEEECTVKLSLEKRNKKLKSYQFMYTTSTKESIELAVSAPINLPLIKGKPFNFRFVPTTITDSGINVNVVNKFSKVLVKAKLTGEVKDGNSLEKLYLQGDLWTNIVHIPIKDLNTFNKPDIEISVSQNGPANDFPELSYLSSWFEIQVSSQNKVLSHKKPIVDILKQNRWAYYTIKKKKSAVGFLTLTVLEGEADLYVKNGTSVYPDLNTFDFKSATIKDDEISLPVSDKASAEYEEFTVGVISVTDSKYRINFDGNSDISVLTVSEGEIVEKKLHKGGQLIVNIDLSMVNYDYVIGFYGEKGQVEVFARYFNELEESFVDSIPDKNRNTKFAINTTPGRLARLEIPKPEQYGQLIFKINSPVSQKIQFFVVRKDKYSSIRLKGGKRLNDVLDRDQEQTYLIEHSHDVIEDKFEIELINGQVTVYITDFPSFEEDKSPVVFSLKTIGNTVSKSVELAKNRLSKGDLGLFKRYLVKVQAVEKSSFVVGSKKSGNTFYNLQAAQSNIITYDSRRHHTYYYKIDSNDEVNTIRLVFEIKNPHWIATYNNAYAVFQNQEELLNHTQIYYVTDEVFGNKDKEAGGRIPANIIKKEEITDTERKYVIVDINVIPGYLIIKPNKPEKITGQVEVFRFELQLVINGIKSINPNGALMGKVSVGKVDQYLMIIPENSVVTLTASACIGQNISVSVKNDQKLYEIQPTVLTLDEESERNSTSSTFSEQISNSGPAKAYYITVQYAGNATEGESQYAIQSVLSKFDDTVTLRDQFNNFENFLSKSGIAYPLDIQQTPWEIHYNFKKLHIPEDFSKRYSEVQKIELTYLVFISDENARVFERENICDVELFAHKPSFYWVKTYETVLNKDKDIAEYPKGFQNLTGGYPKRDMPWHGVLQITARLRQENYDEVSNDATIMFKVPIIITSRPKPSWFYYLCVAVALVVIALIIVVVLKATKKKVEDQIENRRSRIDYVRPTDDGPGGGLELN